MKLKLYRFIKRIEDIIFSILIIIIFTPILIPISIISLFMQGWPILYVSERIVGKNKKIKIFKYRTMVKDAKSDKYGLEEKYMKNGYLDIPLETEVYTPIGRFLEKTQFVELPQVFLVLTGNLSFIGNRPLPQKNVDILKDKYPNNWDKRFESPSGMTGISQVVGKFQLSPEERLELESLYSEVYKRGNILKVDAYIFFSTIILLLFNNAVAYRSYESAKNILLSCLKK
jgi:lipopolysaccharide/colanic/teichoic acid biosynthesis glycosyltransferase